MRYFIFKIFAFMSLRARRAKQSQYRLLRRPHDTVQAPRNDKFIFVLTFILILFFWCSPCCAGINVEKAIKSGDKFYNKGRYKEAAKQYVEALKKDPESDIINYNLGTALYKLKDYAGALEYFQKSLLTEDRRIRAKAHYNLGNTLYQFGLQKEDVDLQGAVSSLEGALEHYKKSLSINRRDKDARTNQKIVQKDLERLKEKLKEQKSQPKSGDSQSKEDLQEQNQSQASPEENRQGQDEQSSQKQAQSSQEDQQSSEQKQQSSEQEQQSSGEGQPQEEPSGIPAQPEDTGEQKSGEKAVSLKPGELSEKEAQMLLEDYQQAEEPKGLLNLRIQHGREREVEKDW